MLDLQEQSIAGGGPDASGNDRAAGRYDSGSKGPERRRLLTMSLLYRKSDPPKLSSGLSNPIFRNETRKRVSPPKAGDEIAWPTCLMPLLP
jgi:hypothetical protein